MNAAIVLEARLKCPAFANGAPYYLIRNYGTATVLTFLDMVGRGVELVHDENLSVVAPSIPLAQAILDDWLAKQEETVK